MNLVNPFFFDANRVRRNYFGGELLSEFTENDSGSQNYPEQWLASTHPCQDSPESNEGLSRIRVDDGMAGPLLCDVLKSNSNEILGPEYSAANGPSLGMCCKLINPAERMAIQCSLGNTMSENLFGISSQGTKAWYIIGTDETADELPYILLGFKEDVTPETFSLAVKQQNTEALESMLHKIPISRGETYNIPPGMAHALGPGVFVYEISDPDSQTVTVERNLHEEDLPIAEKGAQLTVEQNLSVFDCTGQTVDEVLAQCRVAEYVLHRSDEGFHAELIAPSPANGYMLWRMEVVGKMRVQLPRPFGLVLCTAGEGKINWAMGSSEFAAGEYFLQPYTVPWIEYLAFGRLALIIAMPPTVEEV